MPDARSARILHVINDLLIGGAEMTLYRLLSQKSQRHFEHVVISLMDRGPLRERFEELGIPVYTPRMTPGLTSPLSVWRFIRLARQIKPDLIQGWLYHGSLAAQTAGLGLLKKVPVLWGIHSCMYSLSFEKKLTAAVVRLCALLSSLAAKIIFVSHTSYSQHQMLGYDIRKGCIVTNGIDSNLFAPSVEARLSVRSELGLAPEVLLIGMINRFHEMKDYPNFLRAAKKVAQQYPEAHFLLAGRGVGDDNRLLADMVHDLGLGRSTHLLGERSDIPRLLASLDLFCLSSSHGESFPNIVGEAMSSEVPCVVTDVGDTAWMVSDTGRVVPPKDAAALADACKALLACGRETRWALGQAERERVIAHFSLSSVVAKYEGLYGEMIPERIAGKEPAELA